MLTWGPAPTDNTHGPLPHRQWRDLPAGDVSSKVRDRRRTRQNSFGQEGEGNSKCPGRNSSEQLRVFRMHFIPLAGARRRFICSLQVSTITHPGVWVDPASERWRNRRPSRSFSRTPSRRLRLALPILSHCSTQTLRRPSLSVQRSGRDYGHGCSPEYCLT